MTPSRLLPALLLLSHLALGQATDTLRQIDQLFAGYSSATPGVSVLVARGDQPIYQKAFGMADLEHNTPNTIETIFEGGSLAKQFTAASILLLVAEGKLSLDDDVRKYVPELPSYGSPIKIQYLLNHTSGVKDWGSIGGLAGWPRTSRIYTQAMALDILAQQKTLNFKPNDAYSYSNGNYSLLVTIVERVSGKRLEEFTDERLFKPLGMHHTRWRSNFRDIIPGRAVAYQGRGENLRQLMPFEHIYGHGGILTTTGDLLIWNRQLEKKQIGGEAVYKMRVRQGVLNNGRTISYASGLTIDDFNGYKEIAHSGATAGYRGWLAYYPEKKLTVALLSNDGQFRVTTVGMEIAAIFLGRAPQAKEPSDPGIALDARQWERFDGTYRSLHGHDVLTIKTTGQSPEVNGQRLNARHADTLRSGWRRYIIKKPGRLLVMNGTDTASYVRVQKTSAFKPGTYAGDYYSEEARCTYRITEQGTNLSVEIVPTLPAEPFVIKPLYADTFAWDEVDLFEFTRDKSGRVNGCKVSIERAENVRFNRVIKGK